MVNYPVIPMVSIIGHRGASFEKPENTIASFVRAVELGADMIELDIHLTEDDHLVVIHDKTVDRTTNGKGVVASLTLKEIREFDAGNGERIPTLMEVLDTVAGKIKVNIEMKGSCTASALNDHTSEILKMGYSKDDILVSSFSPIELYDLHELGSIFPLGVLVDRDPNGAEEFAMEIDAAALHPNFEFTNLEFIKICHGSDLLVNVWTVNEEADMMSMLEMGVDGLITDNVAQASKILSSM
jgi:glycerophosphoryl diester phosphodiesterase